MPNVKSAAKAMRQSRKRREHNRALRATLRTNVKKAAEVAASGDAVQLAEALTTAMSAIGKASKKHLVHPRKASRMASRLQRRVNKIVAAKPAE